MSQLDAVIALALSEVGYKSNGDNNKYAADIDAHYPSFYNGKKNGFAWCDVFVDWLFLTACGYEEALRLTCQPEKSCGAGVKYSAMYFQKNKQWGQIPVVGAQIFFFNPNRKKLVHTGIVVASNEVSNTVTVVEGNAHGTVAKRNYKRYSTAIAGYGYPDYRSDSGSEKKHVSADIAQAVIRGDYGNGIERREKLEAAGYDFAQVQAEVNRVLGKPL